MCSVYTFIYADPQNRQTATSEKCNENRSKTPIIAYAVMKNASDTNNIITPNYVDCLNVLWSNNNNNKTNEQIRNPISKVISFNQDFCSGFSLITLIFVSFVCSLCLLYG